MDFLMKKAGYEKHANGLDYLKKDIHGRFHIKPDSKKMYDLHYDIDVEWRHFSMSLPERCGNEKLRLRKLSYTLFPLEISWDKKEKKSPQTFADVLKSKQVAIKPSKEERKQKQLLFEKAQQLTSNKKKFKPEVADANAVKIELQKIKKERERNNKWHRKLWITILHNLNIRLY